MNIMRKSAKMLKINREILKTTDYARNIYTSDCTKKVNFLSYQKIPVYTTLKTYYLARRYVRPLFEDW